MLAQHFGRVPCVSKELLLKHNAYQPSDNRFRAAARLRQSLLREQHGWPIGQYAGADGKRHKLGNYVARSAERAAAFINAEISRLVRQEVAYREDGAMIDETKLWRNLLSSTPVVFNLFGPLKLDLGLATRVFRRLLPDFVRRVEDIQFEHSPGRGSPNFTADYTAFDVFVRCTIKSGAEGFCAIEVKYSEAMEEPEARLRPRYDELSVSCGLYKDPAAPNLRSNPLQQLWRQHMLAQSMIDANLYGAGRFVVIAPQLNVPARRAVELYRNQLSDEERRVEFSNISLEAVLGALWKGGASDIARMLYERYCDFSSIDALI